MTRKVCSRQFIESYSPRGYAKEVKEECLTMYVNGNGFRAIERITKVNHNTVIRWVKQVSNQLPDINSNFQTPEVGQLDELETFIGKKKQDLGLDGFRQEIFRDYRICGGG